VERKDRRKGEAEEEIYHEAMRSDSPLVLHINNTARITSEGAHSYHLPAFLPSLSLSSFVLSCTLPCPFRPLGFSLHT
jgi:hypothetical protein